MTENDEDEQTAAEPPETIELAGLHYDKYLGASRIYPFEKENASPDFRGLRVLYRSKSSLSICEEWVDTMGDSEVKLQMEDVPGVVAALVERVPEEYHAELREQFEAALDRGQWDPLEGLDETYE